MATTRPTSPTPPTRPASPTPAVDEFVLPARQRRDAPPLIVDEEIAPGPALPVQEPVLEAAGARLQPLLSCLLRFHSELGDAVTELREAIADDSRAALAGRVGQLAKILQWTEAVSADLRGEVDRVANGERPVDTADRVQRLAGQMETDHAGMRVTVTSEPVRRCWGRADVLAEMLQLGLELTRLRIGGTGSIAVEIAEADDIVYHRILGLADPCPLEAPELAERFSELLHSSGSTVRPDALGPHGTGMVIGVPVGESS